MPARPIDREKILERYKRPSLEAKNPGPSDGATKVDAPSARERIGRTPDEIATRRDDYVAKRRADADAATRAPSAGPDIDRAGKSGAQGERADALRPVDADRTGRRAPPLVADRNGSRVARTPDEIERRRTDQQSSLDLRRAAQAEKRTRAERERIGRGDSEKPRVLYAAGSKIARYHGWSLGLSLNYGLGYCTPFGGYFSNCLPWSWWNTWDDCHNNYWYWWGCGAYSYSWCTHPFAWTYRYWFGCWPYSISSWYPQAYTRYYDSAPVVYSSYVDDDPDVVIYNYGDADDVVVGEGSGDVRVIDVGESVQYEPPNGSAAAAQGDSAVANVLEKGPDSLSRIATQYLADGDRAFRERRYADAAHFYAKAIEFRPGEGVLYLVLSDALFATGDYHYGAFALRRALELDPALAASNIDKHAFYADPAEFDAQLQLLERYLADRPADGDARLLLAANYLFGARPELTNDLLESGAGEAVRGETAGALLLEAAKLALARK